MSARTPLLFTALLLVGCGGRPERYDTPFVRGATVGLSGSVAVVDERRNEVMLLTSPRQNELELRRLAVGKNIVAAVPSRDRDALFVLTRGQEPRLDTGDERPALRVISGGPEPEVEAVYELSDPLQKLALDPLGEWVVAYDQGGVVVNVNELMLVNVRAGAEPVPVTVSSTGGRPERFTFTPPLLLPNGERHRLLVIETSQDVVVLDLDDPGITEFRAPLPRTRSGATGQPAQVVYHDSISETDVASYLAVRLTNDSNVLTLRLGEPRQGSSAAFSLSPNIVDAGGQPSTIDFVETGEAVRGLRLAALVPASSAAVLFDPATSKSEVVEFDRPYSGIARVTSFVADPPDVGDVALLYSDSAASIAFWRLGAASSTPYASFESFAVENRVGAVIDVPGEEFDHLKLLTSSSGDSFFLLDLESRQSHPMLAEPRFALEVAPDGRRAWAFIPGSREFAQLDFASKHPMTLEVEREVDRVFDVERADGGRTALVLHSAAPTFELDGSGDLGVTLFDAEAPDSTDTRFVSGLTLEGW